MGAGSGQLGNAGETCDVRGPGHLARGAGGESPGSGGYFTLQTADFPFCREMLLKRRRL